MTVIIYICICSTPVIITGIVDKWPAAANSTTSNGNNTHAWKNMNYLKSVAGRRTVPIEIGKDYMASNWSQKLMQISEFIDTHILYNDAEVEEDDIDDSMNGGERIGYLAQFPLFEHVSV